MYFDRRNIEPWVRTLGFTSLDEVALLNSSGVLNYISVVFSCLLFSLRARITLFAACFIGGAEEIAPYSPCLSYISCTSAIFVLAGKMKVHGRGVLFENRPALYFCNYKENNKKLIHVCWIPQIDDFIYIMEQYIHY